MPSLTDVLGEWHEFYTLLGTASATLVALLFVAASVGSGVFSLERLAPLRMFLSATVVNFSGGLVVSLIVLAPLHSQFLFGVLIVLCGLFGLAFYAWAWWDAIHDGLSKRIDLEDRAWYAVLPTAGYLLETATGAVCMKWLEIGCELLAVSTSALLLIGIHNAWDITVWTIMRRRE